MIELRVALTDDQLERIAEHVAALLAERHAPANDGYLNADQAAEYLACSRGRLYDLVQLKKLDPVRDGRRLLFRRADLDAALDSG